MIIILRGNNYEIKDIGSLLNCLYLSSKLAKHRKESNLPSFSYKTAYLYHEVIHSNLFHAS